MSGSENPEKTYAHPGHYSVTLEASNASGHDTEMRTLVISPSTR